LLGGGGDLFGGGAGLFGEAGDVGDVVFGLVGFGCDLFDGGGDLGDAGADGFDGAVDAFEGVAGALDGGDVNKRPWASVVVASTRSLRAPTRCSVPVIATGTRLSASAATCQPSGALPRRHAVTWVTMSPAGARKVHAARAPFGTVLRAPGAVCSCAPLEPAQRPVGSGLKSAAPGPPE
jgi:hypothetical protein